MAELIASEGLEPDTATAQPGEPVYVHALWAPYGDWTATIDARTGEVLQLEDRMLRCKSQPGEPSRHRVGRLRPPDRDLEQALV